MGKTRTGFHSTAAAVFAAAAIAATHTALAAMTVTTVSDGETFSFTGATNTETVELVVNAGATVNLPPSGKVFAYVYLTGSGTVTFQKASGYTGGDQATFMRGLAAASTVNVLVKDVDTVNVGWANPPRDLHYPVVDVANMTFEQPGGTLRLVEKTTARTLPSSFEIASGATVALQGSNPLRMGSAFALTDYDIVVLSRASIPSGCTISVSPGRTLGFKPATTATRDGNSTYRWNWSGAVSYFNESFSVALGGKGARVLCRNTANMLRLFTPVTGVGEVVFQPDYTTSANPSTLLFRGKTYTASQSSPVSIPVNTAAEPAPDESWKAKVAHWFDASDADTVVPFSFDPNAAFGWSGAKNEFNGNPIVIGWKDKVEGSNISFYNSRIWDNYPNMKGDYNLQVMPYLVEDGLNGKPYLSFGDMHKAGVANAKYDSNGNLVDLPSNGYEDRRLWAWNGTTPGDTKPTASTTTFQPRYCIMVFGSQQGGGKAILGGAAGTANGNLARQNGTTSDVWTYYDSGCAFKVDGVDVAPRTDKPSGGWQIVSIDMTATNIVVNGLGNHQTANTYGGQNYAEIVFFDEAPTEAERIACEAYLAEKWGLRSTYSFRAGTESFSELSGGEGTTVSIADYQTDDLVGAMKTYSTPDEVTIAGNFRGTVSVAAGKTLIVSDRPAPFDAYDLPQQGSIVAWFDPSLDGAVDFHESSAVENGVARLYSRTASGVDKSDGAYWMGMQAQKYGTTPGIANYYGRYPFLVETAYGGASGMAPTMPWMDFTLNADGESNGNTLRSHVLPDLDVEQTGASKMTFRSLFMALDSSAGGGNPVGDTVAFTGKIKARAGYGKDCTDPIWGDGTVAMAHTWLDTNEVDGATTGYSGRGEVLGFEAAADLTTDAGLVFGYYNPSHGETNYEHIAETLVYSTALADAERQTVQKYLMAKWFGDMNGEFCDLSGATVTGAGDVRSATLRNLPAFDAGFTGSVSGGSAMTFRVRAVSGGTAVVDPVSIGHAVALDDVCAVAIAVSGDRRMAPGAYTLLSAESLSGGATLSATVANETDVEQPACGVRREGGRLILDVAPTAFVIVVK